jgi:DNA-binding transcriptional LysR family regulator
MVRRVRVIQRSSMQPIVSETETIDLRDVRAFCAVYDAGSVTAAAKLLRETKGSTSRRIARLEAQLGVTLLRRSPRLVKATEEGTLYRASVGRALELMDEASLVAQRAQERPRGRLRVTAPSDFAVALLPELAARFVERHPEVMFEMIASDARLDFDAQQLDCALRIGALLDSSLRVQRLLDVELAFYASPAYLARAGAPKRPADLLAHRLVGYADLPRPLEVTFTRRGRAESVALVSQIVGDGSFVHEVVAHGGGIGGIPSLLAARSVEAGRLVRVLPEHRLDVTRQLSFLHPATTFVPAKVRAFRDFLRETLAPAGAAKR